MTQIICKLDLTCKICTTLAVAISAALIIIGFNMHSQLSAFLYFFSFLLILPLLFTPRSISITNGNIRIRMPLWSKQIPLNEYHRADVNKFPLRQSMKILTSFGIGGHLGIHYYKGIGLYKGYFTDYKKVTILRNKKNKKFVVINNINTLLDNYSR